MIELIFVIVIIGILAAVAIPKLAATRDDAKISAEIASVRQVIDNLGAEYTSQRAISAASVAAANAAVNCFTINSTGGGQDASTDGNITVTSVAANSTTAGCEAEIAGPVIDMAIANGVIDVVATPKVYSFGGSTVVR